MLCRFFGGLSSALQCTKLESLILSHNAIEDSFAGTEGALLRWDMLTKLKVLYLHNNQLCGHFPPLLTELPQLMMLNASFNHIEGVLPETIGNMSSLRSMILTGNRIVGPVPLSLAQLRLLRDFHIFKNYEAKHTMQPRGFRRRSFERIYEHGPAMRINSVHWEEISANVPPEAEDIVCADASSVRS